MMVSPASRMLSAISFGVFCRTAPSTSLIMRSIKVEPCAAVMRTRIQSDSTCATGHGRAIATGFADHGRGLACNRGLVDRSNPFDHLAIGGNVIAGFDQHDIADPKAGAGYKPIGLVGTREQLGLAFGTGLAERLGLGLAAAFRDRLGEIGEQHGEP